MFEIKDKDRVRILTAVATRGAGYQAARVIVITISQLLLLAVPLLGIVRLDLWGGHHLLLGESVGFLAGLRGFIVAIGILWGVTFASNIVVGRFFCGWGCPVGYVSRLGEDVELRKRSLPRRMLSHALGAAFVAVFVGAVMLWWVDWRVMLEGSLRARLITGGIFAALWTGGFLHAFVWRFGFCKSACPIGLYYRLVTSSAPIGIVFSNDPSPCIECHACEKICPVDIDPKQLGQPKRRGGVEAQGVESAVGGGSAEAATVRAAQAVDIVKLAEGGLPGDGGDAEVYGNAECIRCGDCIEACRMIFKSRIGETPPLRFGRVQR